MLARSFRALRLRAASADAITAGAQKSDPRSGRLLWSCLRRNPRLDYFMTRREVRLWHNVLQFYKLEYFLNATQLQMKKVVRS